MVKTDSKFLKDKFIMKKQFIYLLLFICFSLNAFAQVRITGKVINLKNGTPIAEASIKIKGTNTGTLTDAAGAFAITVQDNKAILQVNSVGFEPQEITVGTNKNFDISLKETTTSLDDVTVVGYGTQKKSKLTGAVTTVKMADVLGSRAETNIAEALQGTVPGLQITYNTGEPGANTSINIRGTTSIGSGSNGSPLILLDNVPVSSLSLINPNDIETVTVLKDAGSASIYGSRAAWGVILLTSKASAKNSKPKFEYSNNFVTSSPLELPRKASPTRTVQSFKDMNLAPPGGQNPDTWLSLIDQYAKNPSAFPSGYTVQGGILYPLKETDAWTDMADKSALEQIHNLSISGGSDKTYYRLSGGYSNEDGILITNKDNYKRINVTGFISTDITSWATVQLTSRYTSSNKQMPYTSYGFGIFGSASVAPSYGLLGDSVINGVSVPFVTGRHIIENGGGNSNKLDNSRIGGKLILKPVAGLTITGEYTFDKTNTVFTQYDKAFNIIMLNNFVPAPIITQDQAKYYKYMDFTNYHALNIYANYEKKYRDHLFTLTAGMNQEDSYFELLNAQMSNMINPNLPYLDGGTGLITADNNGFDGFSEYAVRGYFYRFNYAYKGKYLLETSGRYDGSSKFPEDSRWGFFPSVSLGWRASDESFMQSLKPTLSDLKVRVSYGNVGNQAISNYQYYAGMTTRPTSNWADASGVRYLSLNAPGLISANFTWEKVTSKNIGIDLGLFNNRFTTTFDVYQRDTRGMLIPGAQLPAVLGANAPLQNTADLQTNGWELQVGWKDKIGKVNYRIGFNLYDSKAKITKYDINGTGLLSQYYVGQEIGEIWGYVTDGVYSVNDFVPGSLNASQLGGKLNTGVIKYQGINPNPGDVRYKDLNNDGVIFTGDNTVSNPGDRKVIGSNVRHYQYGITGGVNWNGFDLSFFIHGVGKRDIYAVNDLISPYSSGYGTLYESVQDYWTSTNTNAFYPRIYSLNAGNGSNNRLPQTKFLLNGAYMRLENITIGYSIPANILKKAHLQSLRFFVSGDDLLTVKHLPVGVDPELSDQGYGGQYPLMKKVSVGLSLNF
jgi:TonB-linked SusC/RagA family outer membrane protein